MPPTYGSGGGIKRGNVLRHIVYSGFLFWTTLYIYRALKNWPAARSQEINEKQNTKTIIDERDKSGNYSTFYRRELASFLAHVALT